MNFLTGEEFSSQKLEELLDLAAKLKKERGHLDHAQILKGKHLAMLFEKPSLRTRFSFAVAMFELGGTVIESVAQNRKQEDPEDLARVLSGYCNGIMIRTHDHNNLLRMAKVSSIPIINALSEGHHPCQILADLLTLKEKFRQLKGLKLAYIGDGNNILNSLLLLAPRVGVEVHYCCPVGHEPKVHLGVRHDSPENAVANAHAVYTDVWESMGFEDSVNLELFAGFQVNEKLMERALPEAVFMHCMPMNRGQEVSLTLPDSKQSVIFQQSENRLHVQKALLMSLL
ncbi:MAG: ornithine carbamoyltransferase [Myxococcaceae bacterium]